jgi:DNA-binding NarL/FixJ family response regulator
MIRILLVDDHVLFREGLAEIFGRIPDFQLLAQAGNYSEAMDCLRRQEFDLAIVELSLPGRDGLQLIETMRSKDAKLPILVLTGHCESELAVRALRAGAKGFLTKDVNSEYLLLAIRRITAGGRVLTPTIAMAVAVELTTQPSDSVRHSTLSSQELHIFGMLANGERVSNIAQELNLSIKTVSTYKARLMKKMNLQNLADLVRYATSCGMDNRL